jgi:hypothetical protein
MSRGKAIIDRRLIGTWQSDRRKTFQNSSLKKKVKPAAVRKLKSLFGKLAVRWGYCKYYTNLSGFRTSGSYKILGKDSKSVVIEFCEELDPEPHLRQIHFEGKYYWIHIGGNIREYFRKVKFPD